MYDWGLAKYNVTLHINESITSLGNHVVIDVETNENGSFVGLGIMDLANPNDVYYVSNFEILKLIDWSNKQLSGHNLKYDFHQLRSWGVNISARQLENDTQLLAYTLDSSNRKNGLKDLAQGLLGITYPTYKELVGTGKNKKTLDKHEVEEVANYCGMDVYCTFQLLSILSEKMTDTQRVYYAEIEIPTLQILAEMESKKIHVDVEKLTVLDEQLGEVVAGLEKYYDSIEVNPRSPKQVLQFLNENGVHVDSTGSEVLEKFKDISIVEDLLEYRTYKKLHSTYTQSLLELTDLPWTKPNFNQALTITGRLSSSDPINWQNIPRSEDNQWGTRLRECISAPAGYKFISADFSQIEYRMLAHLTQEPILLKAFREGKDVHDETGKMLGVERRLGKTLNFGAIYGAHEKKIAKIAKCSVEEAAEFFARYWSRLPSVKAWIERMLWRARQTNSIETIAGRTIKIVGLNNRDKFERLSAERQVISYTIQGSAADIMKIALIKMRENGYVGNLQVHDEVDLIVNEETAEQDVEGIKEVMESCIKLSVPLECSVGIGNNWSEAKG